MSLCISKQTARRYVLGRQGLWPGRRWAEILGTEQALRQCQSVQIDPISAIARNHDIKLWSRVVGYTPNMLNSLLYEDRKFFDFGSILMIYPVEELPYWRAIMRRQRSRADSAIQRHFAVIEHVREEIRTRGPLASRDFADRQRIQGGFNTIKDSAMALYLLWLTGELATHSRRGFDRVYDLADAVFGPHADSNVASEEETDRFFACKAIRDTGLASPQEWARRMRVYLHEAVGGTTKAVLARLAEDGFLMAVRIEDDKTVRWALASDESLLRSLEAGDCPQSWVPIAETTTDEVTLLAPLDNVIWDRARTRSIFDFDYVWEVYKPAHLRRWGYYTLPILYGDRLTARIALRLNRKGSALIVEGFWPDQGDLLADAAFVSALTAGIRRFCQFNEVTRIEPGDLSPFFRAAACRL